MSRFRNLFCLIVVVISAMTAQAQFPQAGDLIFGLNAPGIDVDMDGVYDPSLGQDYTATLELVRDLQGTPATVANTPWRTTPFIQSVEFDNYNGISHNASGNIVGLNFGPNATAGGQIYSFATTANVSDGQLIGDTLGLGGSGLSPSRLVGLSVSPDNTKIAVNGFNSGSLIVYDYTAGDTMGSGAALNNARQTVGGPFSPGLTGATAWLDNNNVLTLSPDGNLVSVNATTMAQTFINFLSFSVTGINGSLAAMEYNPNISPYVFAALSFFGGGATTNGLAVLDPAQNFAIVNEINLSTSANTLREIAFDANGNLYLASFSSQIEVIPNAAANALTLTDNSSIDVFQSATFSSFSGIDIALGGTTPTIDGDFNNDGFWNCTDIDDLSAAVASMGNDPNFDLNGDTVVNAADIAAWLVEGGAMNPAQTGGNPFLAGDATLDGVVDGQDFITWNGNKFTSNTDWCGGNFNGDSVIDGQDFITWNQNKFMSSDSHSVVPEPTAGLLLLCAIAGLMGSRRG